MRVVEQALNTLLEGNPFYAHFFLNSIVSYDKYDVPTAAAGVNKAGIHLIFNTKFIESLSQKEVVAVIEHEVLHILFDHISEGANNPLFDRHIANLAMDLAINQHIQGLPAMALTVPSMEKATGLKLDLLQHWEYYYERLITEKQRLQKQGTLDQHDVNLPGGKPTAGTAKAVIKNAVDTAIKASHGNIPKAVLKVLDAYSTQAQVPWKQVLANFVAKATSNYTVNTRKKSNRRFGVDQPGKRKKRELILGVCADSSGSVSDAAYTQFMAEIMRISKICGVTYIVDADCQVQDVQKVGKGKKVKTERHGGGGTAYQPAIDQCKKLNCNAIVYFGDMDTADQPSNPGVPFLWAIVGDQDPPAKFGGVVRINA